MVSDCMVERAGPRQDTRAATAGTRPGALAFIWRLALLARSLHSSRRETLVGDDSTGSSECRLPDWSLSRLGVCAVRAVHTDPCASGPATTNQGAGPSLPRPGRLRSNLGVSRRARRRLTGISTCQQLQLSDRYGRAVSLSRAGSARD